MSRARRRTATRSNGPLSVRQLLYLRLGATRGTADAFASDAAAFDSWARHAAALLDRTRPGQRPWASWAFDLDRDPPPLVDQPVVLARLGELDDAEVAVFARLARSPKPGDRARGRAVLDALAERGGPDVA